MAFSPFTWFRKHQKVFFAGLTIMCMITFVASFGAGDAVQRGLALIGGRGGRGALVTTLNGTKVYEGDLQDLRRRREMVNQFLRGLLMRPQILRNFRLPDVNEPHRRFAEELRNRLKDTTQDNPYPDLAKMLDAYSFRLFGIRTQADVFRVMNEIETDLRTLAGMAGRRGVKDDPERLRTLQNVASLLCFQAWELQGGFGRGLLYFGGSVDTQGLLDFLLWKHQADKLGIHLTDADVRQEINRDAAGEEVLRGPTFDKDPDVLRYFGRSRRGPGSDPAELLSALQDELRVVFAQGIILGWEPGVRAYRSLLGVYESPAVFTPDEFLKFYRRQRTTLRVELLPVPAANFLAEVKEQPTERELENRFNRYKDKEPDPARREPGFKVPRRIAVQWAQAAPEDPNYREHGRKVVNDLTRMSSTPGGAVARLFAAPLAAVPPGTGVLGRTAGVGLLFAAPVDPIGQEYEEYTQARPPKYTQARPAWYSAPNDFPDSGPLPDVAALRPVNVASTFGALLGAGQGAGGPFAAPTSWYAYGTRRDVRDALRYTASLLLARSGPPLAAVSLAASYRPEPLPLAKVRDKLENDLARRYADELVSKNIAEFDRELSKQKTPKAAQKYIAEAIKKYHFRHGGMDRPRGSVALRDALNRKAKVGLAPLRQALSEQAGSEGRGTTYTAEQFTDELFSQRTTYSPSRVFLPTPEAGSVIWWLSESLPAEQRKFEQVRDQVVRAWRLEKARQLARRAAERIQADLARKDLGPADAVRFLRDHAPEGVDLVELTGVAQLVKPKEVLPGRSPEYQNYSVPPSLREQLPYPPDDLATELLTLKKPGASMVVADKPATTFYVAVLRNRDEPSIKQFEEVYARSKDNRLLQEFLRERAREYYQKTLEQLRRDAVAKPDTMITKDGHFVVPEDVRRHFDERGGSIED